ncbi:MAG: serine/threonine-protein kinase [Gemmatimonadota bacterium]|nr:serine/threonine-protein kinase [Gemmatimonadota bacterium]
MGPYRIIDVLGEGGMGVVYRAEDDRLGRRVALKTLGTTRAADGLDRLWREARAAASLNHPGICQVYDVEEQDGELWVAMELLEGEGLDARMKRERLGVEEAIGIAVDVLSPLAALHESGVVHRDLKPSNIFLTPHGTKILDFGLARHVEGPVDTQLTQEGAIIGTPHYMAPEQWRAEGLGPRSDLFACGAVLYEMLAGEYAFPGDDPIAIFHACAFESPPPLTGATGIEAIDATIRRSIAKDPEERPATAADMSAELIGALDRMRALQSDPGGSTPPIERRAETVRRFIALPFRMLRPDPDLEFLATSLPEAIGGSLSGLQHLAVRSSRLAPKAHNEDGELDLKRLASEAEVDYALAGTLMSAGSRLRLTTELLQVPAGTVVWSTREEVAVDDLFQLQDDLTDRVLAGIAIPLSAGEEERVHRDRSASPRAYELYLRALHAAATVTSAAELLTIRDLLAESVDVDPDFTPARAQYARVCRIIAKYQMADAEEHLERAKRAFAQAFEQDPDSPTLHHLYTYHQIEDLRDPVGAMLRLLERVREMPSEAELWAGLVSACRFCGLYSASIAADRRARNLDPTIETSIEFTYLQLGELDLAVEVAPASRAQTLRTLAIALEGQEEEALAFYENAPNVFEGLEQAFAGSFRDAVRGRPEAAEKKLREAVDGGMPDPEALFFFARVAARAGLTEYGLQLIDEMIDRGYLCIGGLETDPWMRRLAEEPGYAAAQERASERRREAAAVFRDAGGEDLLGVVEGDEAL